MCDSRLFAPQAAALAELAKVTVADLTGADTVEELAAAVLAAAPDRFALAGRSMGGIVAMEVCRQAPERVARLALLDTNHRAETPERQALRGTEIASLVPGAHLRVIEGVGHLPTLEKPAETSDALRAWLGAPGLAQVRVLRRRAPVRARPGSTCARRAQTAPDPAGSTLGRPRLAAQRPSGSNRSG